MIQGQFNWEDEEEAPPEGMTTEEVLNWANQVRANCDLPAIGELPKGIPGNLCSCPLAKAIQGSVGFEAYVPLKQANYEEDLRESLPEGVALWVESFDEGKYPELVDEAGMAE